MMTAIGCCVPATSLRRAGVCRGQAAPPATNAWLPATSSLSASSAVTFAGGASARATATDDRTTRATAGSVRMAAIVRRADGFSKVLNCEEPPVRFVAHERGERPVGDAIAPSAARGRAIRIVDDEVAVRRHADDRHVVTAGVRLRRRQEARPAERDDEAAAPEHVAHPGAVEAAMDGRAQPQRCRHAHDPRRRRRAIHLPVVEPIERVDERGVGQARAQVKAARDHRHARRTAAALAVIAGRAPAGQRWLMTGASSCSDNSSDESVDPRSTRATKARTRPRQFRQVAPLAPFDFRRLVRFPFITLPACDTSRLRSPAPRSCASPSSMTISTRCTRCPRSPGWRRST